MLTSAHFADLRLIEVLPLFCTAFVRRHKECVLGVLRSMIDLEYTLFVTADLSEMIVSYMQCMWEAFLLLSKGGFGRMP